MIQLLMNTILSCVQVVVNALYYVSNLFINLVIFDKDVNNFNHEYRTKNTTGRI